MHSKMKLSINRSTYLLLLLFSVFSLATLSSCKSDEEKELEQAQEYLDAFLNNVEESVLNAELAVIDDSLASWDLSDQVLIEPNGVRYIIHTEGSGIKPKLNNVIRVKYSGKVLSTGLEFDSNDNLELLLYALIAGFQTTLPLIPEGSSISMYIPSVYGYGDQDVMDSQGSIIIPGNSNLIFDVELFEVL